MDYSLLNAIQLFGSIGLFIYGMKIMSEGIQKVTGSTLRSFFSYFTNNKYVGLLTGFSITSLIQSSSAATVMIVSFVNAGLISLKQSFGLIIGVNIGTTITSWLINTLGFIDLEIISFALPIIGIGVPLLYSGSKKGKPWGEFLIGFGILFLGINSMKYSVPVVESVNVEFLTILQSYTSSWFSTPLFILLGMVMTIILQSSSTAMGITLVIVVQGWLPINAAMALIIGENVGTTMTAYIASLVGNASAKRAAFIHILFNIIGLVWAIAALPWLIDLVDYLNIHLLKSKYSVNSSNLYHRGEALTGALTIFHSLFNIVNAVILIHFRQPILNLTKRIIKSDEEGKKSKANIPFNQYIETHEMAIIQIRRHLAEMLNCSQKLFAIFRLFHFEERSISPTSLEKIDKQTQKFNDIQITFSSFTNELSQKNASQNTANFILTSVQLGYEIQLLNDTLLDLINTEKKIADSEINTTLQIKDIIYTIDSTLINLINTQKENTPKELPHLLGITRSQINSLQEVVNNLDPTEHHLQHEKLIHLQRYCKSMNNTINFLMNLKA